MPLIKSKSKEAFSKNVSEMMHAGHPQKQALAAAYATQREGAGRAFGGVAPMGGMASPMGGLAAQAFNPVMPQGPGPNPGMLPQSPPNVVAGGVAPPPMMMPQPGFSAPMGGARPLNRGGSASSLRNSSIKMTKGPIISSVPGRTDKHLTHVPSGSYVIPADIVSAHGEGNTLAGVPSIHKLFKMDEHNVHVTPTHAISKFAKGGTVNEHVGKPVQVKLAGGEIVVPPEKVWETMCRICKKKMTLAEAHDAMDEWVLDERRKLRKTLAKLPGPVRD